MEDPGLILKLDPAIIHKFCKKSDKQQKQKRMESHKKYFLAAKCVFRAFEDGEITLSDKSHNNPKRSEMILEAFAELRRQFNSLR